MWMPHCNGRRKLFGANVLNPWNFSPPGPLSTQSDLFPDILSVSLWIACPAVIFIVTNLLVLFTLCRKIKRNPDARFNFAVQELTWEGHTLAVRHVLVMNHGLFLDESLKRMVASDAFNYHEQPACSALQDIVIVHRVGYCLYAMPPLTPASTGDQLSVISRFVGTSASGWSRPPIQTHLVCNCRVKGQRSLMRSSTG